jgi:hypothetical protein
MLTFCGFTCRTTGVNFSVLSPGDSVTWLTLAILTVGCPDVGFGRFMGPVLGWVTR